MQRKKMSVHMIFVIVHTSLAVVTMLPTGTASKDCFLGYNALCSFSPIGTAILLALAGIHLYLDRRSAARAAVTAAATQGDETHGGRRHA